MSEKVTAIYTLHDKMTAKLDRIARAAQRAENRLNSLDKKLKTFNRTIDSFDKRADKATTALNRMGEATKDQNEQMGKLAKNTRSARDWTNKLDAANKTAERSIGRTNGVVKEQSTSIRNASNEAASFANNLTAVADGERDLHGAMVDKNRVARTQIKYFKQLHEESRRTTRGLNGLQAAHKRMSRAIKDVQDINWFVEGFEEGTHLYRILIRISALLPSIGLAMGGIGAMINGMAGGIVNLSASLGRLSSVLAVIPGLYAAIGVGAVGGKGIFSTILKPAIEGTEDLKKLQQDLMKAQRTASTAGQPTAGKGPSVSQRLSVEAAQRRFEKAKTAEARSNAAFSLQQAKERYAAAGKGSAQTPAQATAAANANQRVQEIQAKIAETMKGMPKDAAKLALAVEAVKGQWQELWSGGNKDIRVIQEATLMLEAAGDLMRYLQPRADTLVALLIKMSKSVRELTQSKLFREDAGEGIGLATTNLSKLFDIARNLAPLFLKIVNSMQRYTGWVLDAVKGWSEQYKQIDNVNKTVGKVDRWLNRGFDSLTKWAKITKNLFGALANVFAAAGGTTSGLEDSLVSSSAAFKEWTSKNDTSMKNFFNSSSVVLKSIGGLMLDIFTAFGVLSGAKGGGKNAQATAESVSTFLSQLGAGIISFAGFANKATIQLGPKFTEHFKLLGKELEASGVGSKLIFFTGAVLDMVNGIISSFIKLDKASGGRLSEVAGYATAIAASSLLLGTALGKIVSPFARFVKWFRVLAGILVGKKLLATIATSPAGGTAPGTAPKGWKDVLGGSSVGTSIKNPMYVWVVNNGSGPGGGVLGDPTNPKKPKSRIRKLWDKIPGSGKATTAALSTQASARAATATLGPVAAAGAGTGAAVYGGTKLYEQKVITEPKQIAAGAGQLASMFGDMLVASFKAKQNEMLAKAAGVPQGTNISGMTVTPNNIGKERAFKRDTLDKLMSSGVAGNSGGIAGAFSPETDKLKDSIDVATKKALATGQANLQVGGKNMLVTWDGAMLKLGQATDKGYSDAVTATTVGGGNVAKATGDVGRATVSVLGGWVGKVHKLLGSLGMAATPAPSSKTPAAKNASGGAATAASGSTQSFYSPTPAAGDSNYPAVNKIKGIGDSNAGVAGGGNTSGLSSAMGPAVALANRMGGTITSGYRPGAITSSGNKSDHSTGNAIDIGGPPALMAQIAHQANSLPGVKQVIYSPVGWSRDGGAFSPVTDAAVKANHYDHVHVAMGGNGKGGGMGMAGATVPALPNLGNSLFANLVENQANAVGSAVQASIDSGSMGVPGPHSAATGSPQAIAQSMLGQFGFGPDQFSPLDKLWTKESGWNPTIANKSSGAYGIPQALPGTKMASAGSDWRTNPATQIKWGLGYIKDRYKTPAAAWEHSQSVNWYGNGGDFVAKKPQLIGVGDKQAERVTVSPLSGPNKNKYSGGGGGNNIVVNANVSVGSVGGDESSLDALSEKVGNRIARDLERTLTLPRNRDY